ncbi:AAA family ATPase [Alsobacter sp. SYSU BS001988]
MLQISGSRPGSIDDVYFRSREGEGHLFTLGDVVSLVKRHWPLIGAVTGAALTLCLIFLLVTTPRYSSIATILIDTRKSQPFQATSAYADSQLEGAAVESQVEVLRSDALALKVIRALKLANIPEMAGAANEVAAGEGRIGPVSSMERDALKKFSESVSVRRVGLTYVLQIEYSSDSPALSAKVANAIADAYIVGELDAKYDATKRASLWLNDRISQLREQVENSERAVQNFKAEHRLVSTGRGTINDQQLADVNNQLVQANAVLAEAQARLERIRDVARSELPDASVADALKSELITRLRGQYLDLSSKEADWSTRYGANHAAVTAVRGQMKDVRRSIAEELNRIAETYQSDVEISRARQISLQRSLDTLIEKSEVAGQAQVKLRELESTAQSIKTTYESFLRRATETAQQQTIPLTEARVISAAAEPTKRAFPRVGLFLFGSTLIGCIAGVAVALARDALDHVLRTSRQIEGFLGIECFGVIPAINGLTMVKNPVKRDSVAPTDQVLVGLMGYAISAPLSRFSETLRNVVVSRDIESARRDVQVIGLISALPGEGKTSVAFNLAQMAANSGRRTMLIDCDLRNPQLTRDLTLEMEGGILAALSGAQSLETLVWTDEKTGLNILPAGSTPDYSDAARTLSSENLKSLINVLRTGYELIIIDLPPVLPVVDAKASAHLFDGYVLVVEWGKTSKDAVAEVLSRSLPFHGLVLGTILNKANVWELRRLETDRGDAYNKYYKDVPS